MYNVATTQVYNNYNYTYYFRPCQTGEYVMDCQ